MNAAGRSPPARARRDAGANDLAKDLAEDRARALALTPVSRETLARLDRFVALLLEWQQHTNLIARSSERVLWTRHIADSLQLLPLAPAARVWADLGTGGGFPGLVIACALAESAGACAHLVESSTKKAAFLREAIRATSAPAVVHAIRIEDFAAPSDLPRLEVVTARALAPLPKLLPLVYPLLKTGILGLFAKGQDVALELTEAAKCWKLQASLIPSRTDPRGRIVVVSGLEPRRRAGAGETRARSR
jgi:16S rRNA (guanine527-N7)-methyltransferase